MNYSLMLQGIPMEIKIYSSISWGIYMKNAISLFCGITYSTYGPDWYLSFYLSPI